MTLLFPNENVTIQPIYANVFIWNNFWPLTNFKSLVRVILGADQKSRSCQVPKTTLTFYHFPYSHTFPCTKGRQKCTFYSTMNLDITFTNDSHLCYSTFQIETDVPYYNVHFLPPLTSSESHFPDLPTQCSKYEIHYKESPNQDQSDKIHPWPWCTLCVIYLIKIKNKKKLCRISCGDIERLWILVLPSIKFLSIPREWCTGTRWAWSGGSCQSLWCHSLVPPSTPDTRCHWGTCSCRHRGSDPPSSPLQAENITKEWKMRMRIFTPTS